MSLPGTTYENHLMTWDPRELFDIVVHQKRRGLEWIAGLFRLLAWFLGTVGLLRFLEGSMSLFEVCTLVFACRGIEGILYDISNRNNKRS